jgi:hypothetical protein
MAIIDKPSDYFNTILYNGNSGTQAITGVGFQPNLSWTKVYNAADSHILVDSVRGDKVVRSNSTAVEYDTGVSWTFDTDGFTMTGTTGELNYSGRSYVVWNWKAGTSFTNDASATGIGDIDSSGSVNTTSGFSIITATSDGAADKNIAHGLGVVPDVILSKNLASTFNWDCYFKTLGYNASLQLNSTAAVRTGAWGSATFTSTTFQTNDNFSSANGSPYIYYCFAEKQGYSKFGSYTGNGNADGPFSFCGFKPAFIMIKRTDVAKNWYINDNLRDGYNNDNPYLSPNLTAAETGGTEIDLLSNGFKITASGTGHNQSGGTYIYMAIAENPFVTSTGVPATAR